MSQSGRKTMTNQNKRKKLRILPKSKALTALVFIDLITALVFMCFLTLENAFPKKITAVILAVLFGVLFLCLLLLRSRSSHRIPRVLGVILSLVMIGVFGLGTYYLKTTFNMFARIGDDDRVAASGVDVTSEPFNIYVSGHDNWGTNDDLLRSDVNMIITVNPQTRTVLLTSMPRDSYVELHKTGTMDKLTHTGIYGIDETLATAGNWLDMDFDYYLEMNFKSFVDVIDAMGGITVNSPVAFKSSISKYSYVEGENELGGKAALYFARERKSFKKEDEARIANQQRVVKAVLKKLMSSKTLLLHYDDVLDAMGKNMTTNMSASQMKDLVRMQMEDLGAWKIKQQAITGKGAYETVASMDRSNKYFVSKPTPESVKAVKKGIYDVMNPSEEDIAAAETARQERSAEGFIKQLRKLFDN